MTPWSFLGIGVALLGVKNLDGENDLDGLAQKTTKPLTANQRKFSRIAVAKKQTKKTLSIIEQIANYNRSILFSAITGCGKTTLIKAVLRHIWEETEGTAGFVIVDPKHSQYGVEEIAYQVNEEYPLVSRANSEEQCLSIIRMIRWILDDFLVERQKNRASNPNPAPLYVVIYEWFALQKKFKSHVEDNKVLEKLSDSIQELIVMGREDNVRVWLISQSHQCGEIGLSKSLRDNVGIVGLAAPEDIRTIQAMATDAHLFKMKSDREAIANNMQKLEGSRFYLSTLGLKPELAKTPIISKQELSKPLDPWEASNESAVAV